MFCGKCGTRNDDDSKFCSVCGNALHGMEAEVKMEETTSPKTITVQIDAGEVTLSGQHKLISVFQFAPSGLVDYVGYTNTMLNGAHTATKFDKSDISGFTYKNVSVVSNVNRVRYIIAVLLLLAGVVAFPLLFVGLAL